MVTGKNLREAREARGLTLAELSQLSGVHRVTINNHERETHKMRGHTLKKVVTALNKVKPFSIEE